MHPEVHPQRVTRYMCEHAYFAKMRQNAYLVVKGLNIIKKASLGVGEFSDADIYLRTMVQGKNAKMLVDTGSTLTIVSENFVSMLDKKARPNVCCTLQPLFSAAGIPLKVKGKVSVNINHC